MASRSLVIAFLSLVTSVAGLPSARGNVIITTPAGVNPGQSFFVVYVDTTGHPATSTNIADYDAFIQQDASGILFPGGTISAWQIIGSTAAFNAATQLLTDTSTPVYDTSSHEISVSGHALFAAPISLDQNGGLAIEGENAWTGLDFTGATASNVTDGSLALGERDVEIGEVGFLFPLGDHGLDARGASAVTFQNQYLYGYAEFTVGPATAIPEPGAITLAVAGIGVLGSAQWARRRKAASRHTARP